MKIILHVVGKHAEGVQKYYITVQCDAIESNSPAPDARV